MAMGARGPAPKPQSLKLLHGGRGRRPKDKVEPQPKAIIPNPPKIIKGKALEEWKRIAPILFRLNVLTEVDGAALAAYCQSWSDWCRATEHIENDGMMIVEKVYSQNAAKILGERLVPNPAIALQRDADARMRHYLAAFGMTPSSRSRVSVNEEGNGQEAEDELGALQARIKAFRPSN